MKIACTLVALLILFTASAQNDETVSYEVNTHLQIQSLRLSPLNDNDQLALAYSIGDLNDSIVCLNLNPDLDYELMVNNTTVIKITSIEIQERRKSNETPSPFALASLNSPVVNRQ